tara:strand:+ start:214 stop:438 length:225 start_codon:yes stop_codon:yes gene_type:complete
MSYTTRSGRQIKKPILYEPKEICEDDYGDEEESEEEGEDIFSSDEESESDEEDADENGNLKGFVVSDSDEEDDA